MDIKELLQLTIDRDCSDLHLVPGYFPTLRINGELSPLKTMPVIGESESIIFPVMTEDQKETLLANREVYFGYEHAEHRFRVNVYFSKGSYAASFRLIPKIIRTIDELGLPSILHNFAAMQQGFILVTGPTGEGKSTTLAAIIDKINQNAAKHILTIEDPIEFVYPPGRSIISQRELGFDTHSWTVALRSALREDPDVVLIGEM